MSRTAKSVQIAALLIIVASILVPVAYGIWFAAGAGGYKAEIARIKAAGEPVSAAELAGKPIADSENGAVIYRKVFPMLPRVAEKRDSETLASFLDHEERARDPKLWSQARQIVRRYSAALPIAREAAAKPKCQFRVDWRNPLEAEFPHYKHLRFLARLAGAKAVLDARAGDSHTAAVSLELTYTLSGAMKDEPGLIGALVRYAMIRCASQSLSEVCRGTAMSEADSTRLSAAIGRIQLDGSLANAFRGERAQAIVVFGRLRSGADGSGERRFYGTLFGRTWLDSDESYYLREMRALIGKAARPYRSLRSYLAKHEDDVPRYAMMSGIMLPFGVRAAAAQDTAIATLRGDRIFLGLLAYRSRFRAYPDRLNDLRKLNWRAADDPFSGRPFIYRREGAGFVLYSIGDDLKDNGGTEATKPTAHPSIPSEWPGKPVYSDIVWKRDR